MRPTRRSWIDWVVGGGSVLAFFLAWQWLADSGAVNPLFTSSPTGVARALADMVADGTLLGDLRASGAEFAAGFGLAVVVGVPLGVMMGWYRVANAVLNPFVVALYATPRIALAPLLVIWLGIDLWSKVAVVFFGAIFPLLINLQVAMRTIDADLLRTARSFGASNLSVFRTIALPASVPFLISGLRLAMAHALVGVVVAELFGATAGLGYRIVLAGGMFRTDQVLVCVLVLVAAALALNAAFLVLERRFDRWRPKQ